jgi:hypothetical protein
LESPAHFGSRTSVPINAAGNISVRSFEAALLVAQTTAAAKADPERANIEGRDVLHMRAYLNGHRNLLNPAFTVSARTQQLLNEKFGVGVTAEDRTDDQNAARKALKDTFPGPINHPAIPGFAQITGPGGSPAIAGITREQMSEWLVTIRGHILDEDVQPQ